MNARCHSLSGYIPPSSDPLTHFNIVRGETRRRFEDLPCLLARAWPDGNFELLSQAWNVLGYSGEELAGRCVCELIALEPDAARATVRSLLTEDGSLEFGLRCKDGREMKYYWNRQFDDFTTSMFIIADELPAAQRRMRVEVSRTTAQCRRSLSVHTH